MIKKMRISIYAVLFCACLVCANLAHACSCRGAHSNNDARILEGVDVAGSFEVLGVTVATWGGGSPNDGIVTITLKVERIYDGDVLLSDEAGVVFVKNDMRDGCSRFLKEGDKKDLMLLLKDGEYWLAGMCTELSIEGWDSFKAN